LQTPKVCAKLCELAGNAQTKGSIFNHLLTSTEIRNENKSCSGEQGRVWIISPRMLLKVVTA